MAGFAALVAQQSGARELFYIAAAKKDTLPKIKSGARHF